MGEFIKNNNIWIVPSISIILTIIIKISSKPESVVLTFCDYFDFGFDLATSSLIVVLSNIKNDIGSWLLILFFLLVMITSIIVNRVGWNKDTKQLKIIGVIIPDILGLFLLVVATLYVGGMIK